MRIIAVGKTKQDFIISGVQEYAKRLSVFISVKWEILPEANKKLSVEKVKEKEAEQILKTIHSDEFVIVLDEKGKVLASEEFAKTLQSVLPYRKIVFVIGGVYGLAPSVLKRGDLVLSFSRFTFTHQMIRMLLMEQLYRAFTIQKGKAYHY